MNTEQMCTDARRRVRESVNRSAGQHLRAMRSAGMAPTSSDIYAMTMESEEAYKFGAWLCEAAGVAFPPVNEGIKS